MPPPVHHSSKHPQPRTRPISPRLLCAISARFRSTAYRLKLTALVAITVTISTTCAPGPSVPPAVTDTIASVTEERELMGTRFRIDAAVADEASARRVIEEAFAEVERCEELLSTWSETSQISQVNRAAGRGPVVVSHELMAVLERALHFSHLTDGAFDITFASCDGLWSVKERRIPSADEIDACLPHVDWTQVGLDHQTSAVFLPHRDLRVGIDGLAKGYRVDRAAAVLEAHGIHDYVVDGGGDMRISSRYGPPWRIAIEHPRRRGVALGSIELVSGAIATSGDYQWYFEHDGVRYHHILDPATGRPARRSVAATVLAAAAVDADALATGLFVMGPERGIALAEVLGDVEALMIAPDLSVRTTSGFPAWSRTGAGDS